MNREMIDIMGLPIDNVSMDQAIERIFFLVDAYQQDQEPKLVVTIHVGFVIQACWSTCRHPEFLNLIRNADLITADGMPIVLLSELQKTPLQERVAGSDMVPKLIKAAAARGKSLYFLGGPDGAAQKTAENMKQQYQGVNIVGIDAPTVHLEEGPLRGMEEEDKAIVQCINMAGPDILLIAFGCPKQELWFARNRHRLRVPVSMGVGATFEFMAETTARAPVWMQKVSLEWLFRVLQEPGRYWKRYVFGLFKFTVLCVRNFLFKNFK